MPPFKHTALAVLCACSLTPFAALATGLGDIGVRSQLGDRFRAEIPLVNAATSVSPSCFQLTTESPDGIADVPWLKDAQIALLSSPPRLVITTRRQVEDPLVQLAVYTGCGVYLTRHYTALLSPPEESSLPVTAHALADARAASPKAAPEQPAGATTRVTRNPGARTAQAGESAADMAHRLYPHSRRAQQRFIRQMVALNPEWLTSESGDETLPEGANLRYPAPPERPLAAPPALRVAESLAEVPGAKPKTRSPAKVEPAAQAPATISAAGSQSAPKAGGRDRLVLMPSDAPLPPEQAASHAAPGEIDNRLSAVEVQVGTMRAQLSALRAEYPTPPPAIQTLFIEMETRLMAVELNAARVKLATLAANAPPAPAPAADAQTAPAGNEQALPVPTPPPAPAQAASAPVPSAAPTQTLDAGLAILAVFGLGLGAFLYRRATRGSGALAPATTHGSLAGDGEPPPEAMPTPAVPPTAGVDEIDDEIGTRPRVVEAVDEAEHDFSPIDLANIMLTFGRTQGAVEVLQSAIEANPKESLQPGLRLLEIYKQADMRREFEQQAGQLGQLFNVERIRWEEMPLAAPATSVDGGDGHRPPGAIEGVPEHIRTLIASNWGTRECLDGLHELLRDNRNGLRKGFSLSVTHEILGLIKTLEDKLKVD